MDIKRDRYATLAAIALDALRDPISTDNEVNFPDLSPRLREVTFEILRQLAADNHMLQRDIDYSYIEPGCLEHGVIHVNVCDPTSSRPWYWLEIDPVTGLVGLY